MLRGRLRATAAAAAGSSAALRDARADRAAFVRSLAPRLVPIVIMLPAAAKDTSEKADTAATAAAFGEAQSRRFRHVGQISKVYAIETTVVCHIRIGS